MPQDRNQKYKITIRNWDKYQREMQGEGKRKGRRSWVSLSVDLFSDPDFIELTLTDRLAWVGLLLHAGKVGDTFELSPSLARVMFQLKHSPDFQSLENQGFIDLQVTTNKTDRTNKTDTTVKPAKKPPARSAEELFYPEGLNHEAWTRYVEHRRDIKAKKLTPKGAAQAMKKWANTSPEAQMRAVEASIANGWTGCFPEKEMPGRGKETPFDRLNRELREQNAD